MIRFTFILALGFVVGALPAAEPLPASDEIVNLLKQHYVDGDALDAQKVNDASVTGLLQSLGAGARLMSAAEAASNRVATATGLGHEALARVEVIDPDIGYIRLTEVMNETTLALDSELKKFTAAKVTGYVLDLRFADGTNFAAAAAVASRFLAADVELFTLKQARAAAQGYRTTEAPKTLAGELADAPLLLLVNAQTSGSAEVLAGALRAQDRGILVGSPTAGLPVTWADVPLADGRVLRLATAKITFAKGGAVFPGGIIPDILVKIDPKTEREAVFNLQTNVTLTASLAPRTRKRLYTEATLVKAFRGESIETPGLTLTNPTPASTNTLALSGDLPAGEEPEPPASRDAVLQRAVDILKGIRVSRLWQ